MGPGSALAPDSASQLVNLPYAYQAAMNTVAAKNAAAAKAKQDQLNQANQNKPGF
jgi:hypothetical protein